MASRPMMAVASATFSALAADSTPAQGAFDSAGAGITGGYTGDSLSLKIIIAFLLGLALYNAIELIILIFVTFQRFHGLYFWSLVVATTGIIPYALGFLIKFFQLLDPNESKGYVAVVLLTIGWYPMVTGQSVVLWSRLHLLTNSRRVLRYTLYMIIINGFLMHSTTTVLTFGSNSNTLTTGTLRHFVNGYSIMEKIQMVVFFLQEVILSIIYIREAIRLLKMSEVVHDDIGSIDNGGFSEHSPTRSANVRKTMYQLLAINVIIIMMDLALLAVEFANLYLIETTLKGVVYSIKLKLEFAVLGKLVQMVQIRNSSSDRSNQLQQGSIVEHRATSTGATIEKTETNRTNRTRGTNGSTTRGGGTPFGQNVVHGMNGGHFPDFVDPQRASTDFTHARPSVDAEANGDSSWENRVQEDRQDWRRRARAQRGSWIDEEMDKHNIG